MAMTIERILEALRDPEVKVLNLSHSALCADDMRQIAELLPESNVTAMDLKGNGFGKEGAIALAEVLPLTQVQNLCFRWNNIGDEGMEALAAALPASRITVLDFMKSHVNDAGALALALARALPHSKLLNLGLTADRVKDVSGDAFAAVMDDTLVMEVRLWNNQIHNGTDQACKESAVVNRMHLQMLADKVSRRDDEMSTEDWQEIAHSLPALQKLLVSHVRLNEQAAHDLLLETAETASAQGYTTKGFILWLLPLKEAATWLNDHGDPLTIRDFVNDDGAIPQDRFLCQRGAKALFELPELWENKTQVRKAYESLPDCQKHHIRNAQQLAVHVERGDRLLRQEIGAA